MESEITDTTMKREDMLLDLQMDTIELMDAIHLSFRDSLSLAMDGLTVAEFEQAHTPAIYKVRQCQSKMILDNSRLDSLMEDKILLIGMNFKYRAKNGMGALTIQNSRVVFFPPENRFSATVAE